VLRDGPVVLRPYRSGDGRAWSQLRLANELWLAKWEPTSGLDWSDANSIASYRLLYRELKRSGRQGTSMPFAIWYDDGRNERMVGQISLANIVRRAFCSAYAGYWVDARAAGRGIMPTSLALTVDHAFRYAGLHRVEVNIRPENAPSRRVVEKLGFREEAYHAKYLHIDGAWRDHVGYAMTIEDVMPEGGLMARWQRLRGRGHVSPDRA
jgi:ribosomal-protein-alanine N-acetyltransferase